MPMYPKTSSKRSLLFLKAWKALKEESLTSQKTMKGFGLLELERLDYIKLLSVQKQKAQPNDPGHVLTLDLNGWVQACTPF